VARQTNTKQSAAQKAAGRSAAAPSVTGAAPASSSRRSSGSARKGSNSAARKSSASGTARKGSKPPSAPKSKAGSGAASGTARKRPSSRAAATGRRASSTQRSSSSRAKSAQQKKRANGAADTVATKTGNGLGKIAKGALAAMVGGAAVGLAGRAAAKRNRRPTVLGVKVPRGMAARNLKLKSPRDIDVKTIAKRVEHAADRLERTSEDVRLASAQAKRVSKRLS
jgi:hypothetical protein